MNYFCPNKARKGTCYHEYQRGHEEGLLWQESSLYIHDDIAIEIGLHDINFSVLANYDPYSAKPYPVTKQMWEIMLKTAISKGGNIKNAMLELEPWVKDNFKKANTFTIVTI